jgi:hypothetical protein
MIGQPSRQVDAAMDPSSRGTLQAHNHYSTNNGFPSRTRSYPPAQGTSLQFSMTNLGTRSNSRVLFVTNVKPRRRAWAAINRLFAPIIVPSVFRPERIFA